ncbi:hypothetical protein G6F40_013875 [Rhizopus arrhizus]|nr:hypothetical protein G6F40_013875 [Rhizopus arrhizus]
MQKVSSTSSCGVSMSMAVSAAITAATSSIQPWVASRYLRRSTMSASVPAASASSTIGTVVADCTSATINGEPVRSAITQAAATSLTQVPMLLARIASQIERNIRIFNGDQAPAAGTEGCDAVAFTIAMLQRSRRTACPGLRPASVQDRHRPRPAAAAIASVRWPASGFRICTGCRCGVRHRQCLAAPAAVPAWCRPHRRADASRPSVRPAPSLPCRAGAGSA